MGKNPFGPISISLRDAAARNKVVLLLYATVLALFACGQLLSRGFLDYQHVGAILRTASFLGTVAIGQTIVILTGGIDLSVGPQITMANVFVCMLLNGSNANNLWAIVAIVALGIALGFANGLGVNWLRISPLVMTLAMGSLITGLTLIFSQGEPKGFASPFLIKLGGGSFFGSIPIIVFIWLVLSVGTYVLLRRSVYGRELYYVGANVKAAKLSGIRVKFICSIAYALSGAAAAITGVLMAGYTRTAYIGIGGEYVMWSVTAVVIGGTSLLGGAGGYVGTIAGSILMVLIESILTIVQIPEAGRRIADGLLILIMLGVYFKRSAKRL